MFDLRNFTSFAKRDEPPTSTKLSNRKIYQDNGQRRHEIDEKNENFQDFEKPDFSVKDRA